MSKRTLTAKSLEKSFKTRKVVDGVSFDLKQKEVVGLLGPNGAGKTTSFYMLVGLVRLDAGSIQLDGEDITRLPMHQRARRGIGYLPQEASIFKKLTVADNIMAVLELRKDLSRSQRQEKLSSLLDELHIKHIATYLGASLSGGERRRVEIARTLATDPAYILLDEPFAGIDPISVIDIKSIITHLTQRGIGVLITDHNVRETLNICDRAYIMNKGALLAEGTPQSLLSNQAVKDVYLGEHFEL